MADYTDDFVSIGAVDSSGGSDDNFDCDIAPATSTWQLTTDSSNAGVAATQGAGKGVDNNNCINVTSAAGVGEWYNDVSSGSRFKITEKIVVWWFYYVKGKGDNYLTQTGTAVVVRLYFGGTTKYADYRMTATGDLELKFGWQAFAFSGKNMNGGSIGGGHNDGTDWDADIHRIELRLDFANANTGTSDAPLAFDNWQVGTKITLTGGTLVAPKSFTDIEGYSNGTGRTAGDGGPLGLVTVEDTFINFKCGLDVGNGSDGSGNEGNLSDSGKFILFNQWSEDVKTNLVVENYSSAVFGTLEDGSDGDYPVDGCQLVLPASRYSDINVKNGGTLKLYDCKLYRWRYIYLGASSDTGATCELNRVDVDSCETIYFRATTLNLTNIEIHDNAQQVNNYAAEMIVTPDVNEDILIHDCMEGIRFRETVTVEELFTQDNTESNSYDIGVLEGKTVTIRNGVFDKDLLFRMAS